jgi:D-alanine--poly(phosphoribitol) ligase subunit 1
VTGTRNVPPLRSVHAAVVECADRAPHDLALVQGDERVDYRTLTTAARVLAGRLAAWGVRPGDIVPLLVPRSAQLIALISTPSWSAISWAC